MKAATTGLWIIIPAHNEEKNLGQVIDKCKTYSDNVLVVDDGSTDLTFDIAKSKCVKVLKHIINLGKGATLKTGCDYALKNNAEQIVLIDADGQHDPDMIPFFLEKLKHADIVFGVRRFNKKMPFIFRFGNSFINFIIQFLFHVRICDSQSGYRAFWARIYRKIRWQAHDYSMESEMIANVGRNNLRYAQLPISTVYNDKYKGTTIFDGIKIVYYIIKWRLAKW
jgi:glycosyltransferase involved in cell wall biosynthesis